MSGGATRAALRSLAEGARPLLALRLVRIALVLGALAIVLRLVLGLLLAGTIGALIRPRGLTCAWDDLDLSIFSGRGEVHALTISPRRAGDAPPPAPIVAVDYAVFDLEVLPLFVGKLRVQRLEVDGAEIEVARTADGEWNWMSHVPPATARAPEITAASAERTGDVEIVLAPPLVVDALRFQDVYLHLSDATFTPPLERELHVDAGVTDLWKPGSRTRFAATVTGDKILDGAHVEGEADWTGERLALDLRAQLGGLRPRELAAYLEAVGVSPACDAIQGRFVARIDLAVVGPQHDKLEGTFALTDLHLSADGIEALALDRLQIDLGSASRAGASIPGIEATGARVNASFEPGEALRFAGLDFSSAPAEPAQGSALESIANVFDLWSGESAPPWAALFFRDDPRAYAWSIASLALRGGEVHLVDRRVEPAAEFPILIDAVELTDIVHAPATFDAPPRLVPVRVEVRVPGTVESIRVAGTIAPCVPHRSIDLAVDVQGLGFDAMTGYLHSAGLEKTDRRGGLQMTLFGEATTEACGATTGHLELDEHLTLDGEEASQLGRMRASDLALDPANGLCRVGDVEISGTRILLARDPSRRLVAFGVRTLGLGATSEAKRTSPSTPVRRAAIVQKPAPRLPRIEIGRFAWSDNHIVFMDEAQDPPLRVAIEPIGFELTNLTLGGVAGGPDPAPAHFVARAHAAGVFDELALEGAIRTKLGDIDLAADLDLAGAGFSGALVAPYLRPIGIQPGLTDAGARLRMHGELRHDAGWSGCLRFHDGELVDAGAAVMKLGSVDVDGVVETRDGVTIASVVVVDPYARIERRDASALRAGGLVFVGLPEATAVPRVEPPPALAFPALPHVRVEAFAIRGARVAVHDASVDPAVDSEILLSVTGKGLSTQGDRGTLDARLEVPGTIEAAEAHVGVVLGDHHAAVDARMEVRGLRDGPLARFLPSGIDIDTTDGRWSAGCELEVGAAAGGGLRGRLALRDLSCADGNSEPMFACTRAEIAIPRFDPAAGVLEIGPVDVEGVEVDARRDEHGALHALGLQLGDAPAAPPPAATPAHAGLEHVRLAGSVSLALERFRFRDAALGEGAVPLDVGVHVRVPGPLDLAGDDPGALPPIAWTIDASVRGLVESCRITGNLRLFGDDPGIEAELSATGVRTPGLLEIFPALAADTKGDVEHGTLEGRLDVRLALRRAHRGDPAFDRPFGADIRLSGLAFRSQPGGDVLAGFDAIEADVDKIDLAHHVVHVKQIEITKPRGLARRAGDTLSVCGLAIDLATKPPAEGKPAPQIAAAPPQQPGTGEIRVDRVLVSGVDVEVHDTTRDPAVVIPLAGLDVEAGPFTTRAVEEHGERVPLRFHAVVEGGAPVAAGSTEPLGAPVFGEIVLAGNVTRGPQPSGWVRLSATGVELPELFALFPPGAVEVREGALDLRVHAKFHGKSGTRVDSTLVFTDLDLQEPKGGPIEKGLALPVALDGALFLLRNPAGEHRISIGFTVGESGLSSGQITLAAVQAGAEVLAVALVGAPLRLLSALTPKSDAARGPRAVRRVAFPAGGHELPANVASALYEMRRTLEGNAALSLVVRHELCAEDVRLAEQRANPSAPECLELVARARQRKAELLRGRAEAATRARTLLAVGAREAREASEVLRRIDREIAAVDGSLDSVLGILRSPSERAAKKRTRVAALEIAQARLDAIAGLVRSELSPEAVERLDVRAPRFDVVAGDGPGQVVVELLPR